MNPAVQKQIVEKNWMKVYQTLNESQRRWYAAARAEELGRGGVTRVSELTGLSRTTVTRGAVELKNTQTLGSEPGVRQIGGGRKRLTQQHPTLVKTLEIILEETTVGDPMCLLRWTTKSTRNLAEELSRKGYTVSAMTVCRLLHRMDYSLQGNYKTKEGGEHPDRDEQFQKINRFAQSFRRSGDPVISVDTKKKERVGSFKNAGKTWRKQGDPEEVNVYDFPYLGLGTASPYGIYDTERNEGMVNVGISHDTSEFAVESIRQWWCRFGALHYPNSKRLLICADGGGSNGSRNRGWKYHLQDFSDACGLRLEVCHYPPGTSKWNKIEHRMFSFISLNWKGKPLVNYETVVELIGGTKTRNGLKVRALLDSNQYETGKKISDLEMENLNIRYDNRYPQWNYRILSRNKGVKL